MHTSRNRRRLTHVLRAALLMSALATPALADTGTFIANLWPDAKARGVSRPIFDEALAGWHPSERVTQLQREQPEFGEGVGAYIEKRVNPAQINKGQQQAQEWTRTLAAIERKYGVDAKTILAIWGMETNFGGFTGGTNTVTALATLAYNGNRSGYFRNELLTALEILDEGHVSVRDMKGSWAGAMGQTQFMPSSFMAYAVDHNSDGRIDIWNSIPDALASTANYLMKHGWRSGETWGYEVTLPRGFDFAGAWTTGELTIQQWQAKGIARANGREFPRRTDKAQFYMPAGADGPVFLVLHNFDVLKSYNSSNSYALAVGTFADRIAGGGSFVNKFPSGDRPLSQAQRREVQQLLNAKGYDVGTADGAFGPRTRAAIMAYQGRNGMTADGFASSRLLIKLR